MAITLYPYKLSATEMEARIPARVTLLPGQLLRLEGENESQASAFVRVTDVKAIRKKAAEGEKSRLAGYAIRLNILLGQPNLTPQEATPITDDQLAQEVQRLQEPMQKPFALSPAFSADATKLGTLTLIEGDDLILKCEVLMALTASIQPYKKIVIVDPLGLFPESPHWHTVQAGPDLRLSLQAVGHQAFLDAFGQLFPEGLRSWALQAVAVTWPVTQEFIPFDRLLDWRAVSDSPLKSLILQNHQTVLRSGVFAEKPQQVMQWPQILQQRCNVVDLSTLSAPWKSLFYQELVRMLLSSADTDILPVLIYPDHALLQPDEILRQAEAFDLSLLVLASAHDAEQWRKPASNRITAQSQDAMLVEGALTLNLPIRTVPVSADETNWKPSSAPAAPAPIQAEWQQISQGQIQDLWAQTETMEALSPPPPELKAEPSGKPATKIDQEALDYLFPHQEKPAPPPATAPTLDYPDADEGALPETALSYRPSYESAPPEAVAFPGTDGWTTDEFNFDLNLDQREDGQVEVPLSPIPQPMPVYSGSSGGFPENAHADEPQQAFETDIQRSSAGPIDLTHTGDALLEGAAPVYHPSAGQASLPDFQPGERVRHEKYGPGVITKVVPMQEGVVLNVTFESVGKRLLDPTLASLVREA